MEITISNNVMTITMPMGHPEPSKSGKSTIIASTHGNIKTSTVVDGKPLTVSVNAYISK